MKETIIKMIETAEQTGNFEIMELIGDIIDRFAITINCPSNWRDIGTELEKIYNTDEYSWVYETLKLWEYEE